MCPVYERTGGHAYGSVYPGPIGAILDAAARAAGGARRTLPCASTLCGACAEVCPVRIDIPRLLVHLRGRVVREQGAPLGERAAMRVLAVAFARRRAYEAAQRALRLGRGPLRRARWPGGLDAVAGAARDPVADLPRVVADAMSARDEILARVRHALADVPADEPLDVPAVDRASYLPAGAARPDPVARFAERAADYRATVRRARPDALAATVAEICASHGARRMAVPAGLPAEWVPAQIQAIVDDGLSARALDALDGVLSGCALAIAETGTVVLDGGARCGRRALTLVPDLHVCVVETAQIVDDLPAALTALESTRPITFVSGPSATSDIELERVEGVHGPRRLELVIVADDALRRMTASDVSAREVRPEPPIRLM